MPHFAWLNRSRLSTKDLAFIVRGVNVQLERDFCPAWGLEAWPGAEYLEPPAGQVYPLAVLDDIGDPGALGYHDDAFGLIYGRVLHQSFEDTGSTASHEALEMRADPEVNVWRPMPDGRETALEVCDAVEADSYQIDVELFGERRAVTVSNFVLPAWYQADAPPPYDFLGKLAAPFTMTPGGYLIVRANDGSISNLWGFEPGHVKDLRRVARKISNAGSRLHRRLAAFPKP